MAKYIDADLLIWKIKGQIRLENLNFAALGGGGQTFCINTLEWVLKQIDSLQQDDTQVDKMLCSQIWWEEQGWIMIPPDATIEGIDSLLKQVRKKFQQEHPSLPSELGEAAEEYAFTNWEDNDYHAGASEGVPFDPIDYTEKVFIAGAEWQKQHDAELIEIAYNDGITIGMTKQKKQMMKEAVEGKVAERVQGKLYARCQVPKTMGVEFGDKVRIIIVKED